MSEIQVVNQQEFHCFKCDKPIEKIFFNDDFSNPPNNATYWNSQGNYGSSVYDNYSGHGRLEIYICDDCLSSSNRVYEVYEEVVRTTVAKIKVFNKE